MILNLNNEGDDDEDEDENENERDNTHKNNVKFQENIDGPKAIDQVLFKKYLIYSKAFVRPVLQAVDSEKVIILFYDVIVLCFYYVVIVILLRYDHLIR